MCGIIAAKMTQETKRNVNEWFNILAHRGTDSYGFIHIDNGKVKTFKHLKKKVFIKAIKKLNTSGWIIMHNRWKSLGAVTTELAHPITSGNTHVIHNGTNKGIYTEFVGKSDTDALSKILEVSDIEILDLLMKDVGVVFKVTDDGVVDLRIDSSRPLAYNEEQQVIASEPLFDGEWQIFKEGVYKNFSIDNLQLDTDKIKVNVSLEEKCKCCHKTHLHGLNENICNICLLRGKTYTPIKTTYASWRNADDYYDGMWDDYFSNNNDDEINIEVKDFLYILNPTEEEVEEYTEAIILADIYQVGDMYIARHDENGTSATSELIRCYKKELPTPTTFIDAKLINGLDFSIYYNNAGILDFVDVVYREVDVYNCSIKDRANNKYLIIDI